MKVELHHDDFRNVEIEPVDLILTDPPYGAKYMYLWDALGILGKQSLKPGGWLIAYAGQACIESGRNVIAYEINDNVFNTLKERVAQLGVMQ
ncbi:MAG: class I SAM-dependent methyltransferase [Thermoproteota archaeon]